MARLSPIMPVIAGGTRFQPVYVGNVADAVIASLTRGEAAGGLYELGGPRVLTFREVLTYVLEVTGRHRPLVALPMPLARLQALVLQQLPGKLLTTDQLILLSHDNVVAPGAKGLTDLGIVPTPIETVVPSYLRCYAPGGGRRPILSDFNGTKPDLTT
jgi:NADH dehydrogenase